MGEAFLEPLGLVMGNRKLWTTREGTKIRIKDMSDSHLCNTIHMLERSYARTIEEAYSFSGTLHGEMAELLMDNEISRLEEGFIENRYPIYADMRVEADRRGLEVSA